MQSLGICSVAGLASPPAPLRTQPFFHSLSSTRIAKGKFDPEMRRTSMGARLLGS